MSCLEFSTIYITQYSHDPLGLAALNGSSRSFNVSQATCGQNKQKKIQITLLTSLGQIFIWLFQHLFKVKASVTGNSGELHFSSSLFDMMDPNCHYSISYFN